MIKGLYEAHLPNSLELICNVAVPDTLRDRPSMYLSEFEQLIAADAG